MPTDLTLASAADWSTIQQQVAAVGGCTIPWSGSIPPLFSPLELRIAAPGVAPFLVTGQLVQAFGNQTVAVMFDDPARAAIAAVRAAPPNDGRPARDPGATSPPGDDPATPESQRGGGQRGDEPVWKRYENLSRAEKIHLAKYGSADERRQVLRDRDSTLHGMVLANPGCTAQEIATLMKTGQVSGQFVLKVAERRDLYQNPIVADALVFHPLTPIDLAEKLVGSLPIETVRRIAKQGNLRMQVVTAARRRVSSN